MQWFLFASVLASSSIFSLNSVCQHVMFLSISASIPFARITFNLQLITLPNLIMSIEHGFQFGSLDECQAEKRSRPGNLLPCAGQEKEEGQEEQDGSRRTGWVNQKGAGGRQQKLPRYHKAITQKQPSKTPRFEHCVFFFMGGGLSILGILLGIPCLKGAQGGAEVQQGAICLTLL